MGVTPVHVAAALGYYRVLELFLEQPNCNINAEVKFTELHL